MARSQYADTIMYVDDTSGDLKPAGNARISVYAPGTTTIQTIYTTRTAGTTKSNPFTTASDGAIEFWAEWGDYDVKIEDLDVPARFGTKTIGWQATTGAAGAVPFTALDSITVRQTLPIGGVIAWWRPNNTVSLPTGYAVCDGSSLGTGAHDFGTGSSITLPDLRNKFILGANSALADAAAATDGDTASNAPGIRGTGASHARNLQHSHTVNSHDHGAAGSHTHGILTDGETGHTFFTSPGYTSVSNTGIGHNHGGGTDAAGSHTHAAQSPGTNNQLGSAQDIKPLYVGLLYIMKVKRD